MTTWGSKLLRAPQWRAARWATVGLVAANLIGLNAWAWKEQSQLAAKRQAVRDVLVQTFPGVRVVVDAPVQMTRELALLRQAAGGVSNGDFERILESFGAEVPVNNIPSAIEYVANEVRLKGLNLTSAQLAQATDNLRRQGMAVRSEGDAVVIRAEGAP
jgi:general secretion pathway protein L